MTYLLDTHLLLWAAAAPERLSSAARDLIEDSENDLIFSVASVWEVAIKSTLGRPDFSVSTALLRRGLLEHGYTELAISGAHALAVCHLPVLHRDPFDRMLVAQAEVEGMVLMTNDAQVAAYQGAIRAV